MNLGEIPSAEKPFYLLLTIDFEEQRRLESAGLIKESISESLKGTERLIELLERLDIKATWFTTAAISLAQSSIFQSLVSTGQEIALHGLHDRDDYNKMNKSKVRNRLGKAKQIVETLSGQELIGFRAPRFQRPSLDIIRELGLSYDSSLHPTPIPSRYSGRGQLTPHKGENGLSILPVSVVPGLRLPLSWFWFRALPESYMRWGSSLVEANSDYLCLYFHPWDFVDLSHYKKHLPPFFTSGSRNSVEKLESFLRWGLSKDWKSLTIRDYLQREKLI